MALPTTLTETSRRGRLLLLWGAFPFPLTARPPVNRAITLNRWATEAEALPPSMPLLPQLPPLPLLSLDPTNRLEQVFAGAGAPLQIVRTRRDAPAGERRLLFKLAGDLERREGVVLSRMELQELRNDPDKSYLLDEARRLTGDGALLLLGCDPAAEDFRAWWSALAPALGRPALFVLGEPSAAWPEGAVCLGPDFAALKAGLWTAQPESEATAPLAPDRPAVAEQPPPQTAGPVYNIHIQQASGLAIGDRAQVVRGDSSPSELSPTDRLTPAPGDGPRVSSADEPNDPSATLRQQLDAVFTAEALTIFCFDRFPAVYRRFSAGLSKRQKIRRLVTYCTDQGQLDVLLTHLRKSASLSNNCENSG
jgi:hypothetical protein